MQAARAGGGVEYSTESAGLAVAQRISLSVGHRRCPYCGSRQVLRSKRRNILEHLILPLALLRPFRCRECTARHFAFFFRKRESGVSSDPGSKDDDARQ